MTTDETAQRVIGLLTAAYTIDHEGGTAQDFAAMVNPLLDDLLSFDLEIRDASDIRIIAESVTDQINQNLKPAISETIATFLSAFMILCREYEAACPDADIPSILQNFGLSIDPNG